MKERDIILSMFAAIVSKHLMLAMEAYEAMSVVM